MSIYTELESAWEEFRAIAGVDVMIGSTQYEAVLAQDIERGQGSLFEAGVNEDTAQIILRQSDWSMASGSLGTRVTLESQWWRVRSLRSHPSSPFVIINIVREG